MPNIETEYEAKHISAMLAKNREIKQILEQAAKDIAKDIWPFKIRIPDGGFRVYWYNAGLENKIDSALKLFNDNLEKSLIDEIKSQWSLANDKNDALIDLYTSGQTITAAERILAARQLNLDALDVFLSRKEAGMNLSKRVWNITEQNKNLIETYLGSGITTGRSATETAKDLQILLIEPDKAFKRIRTADGKALIMSPAAQAYHPGQGVYRSSFQNALRLAATEGNIAYRRSDYERRQQLPFVTGIEVHLSASHPEHDICDAMKGVYPSSFLFDGWHPRCLCYTTSVIPPRDEVIKYFKEGTIDKRRYVRGIPESAKDYLKEKADKLNKMKNKPYWAVNFNKDWKLKNNGK